ncbi:related to Mitochondrial distribution and morphology protein 32 [Saccharomycodes ludwigii]|uniref:Mitochondrial distribution and morphology protein 32 n=1 Tax=Saccharomycodes ludwigii TaxID=36035 RepID=A0A376BBV2_9ASCO|nr:hypothetical protein SCDLUD_003262 [Saccharomycodes ludwigii]KAH3900290.1 hypothetical protein SCDLUD_003262 [Saccharomycodes ludwigii]SSD62107.1 related to Mitochondrial distribution and morphology protein 32 [Saccharomycodes ludwigii]
MKKVLPSITRYSTSRYFLSNTTKVSRIPITKIPIFSPIFYQLHNTHNFSTFQRLNYATYKNHNEDLNEHYTMKPPFKPTKEQLLKNSKGFLERFRIRSKWLLIKDYRPFNVDEISTLFSWFFIFQILWIILGTTTFVSLILFSVDKILGTNKDFVSMILNKSKWGADKNIQFVVMGDVSPNWRKGFLAFKCLRIKTKNANSSEPIFFDLTIKKLELTLSLRKWLNGQGLINEINLRGIEGNINLWEDPMANNWIKNHNYQINKIVCQDCHFIYNEDLNINIFNMTLPKLRFKYCMVDFFNATVVSGSINDSLFTIHKRQHSLAYTKDLSHDLASSWERISRLRIDQTSIRDLGLPRSKSFNWIDDGKLEITADIMIPKIESVDTDNNDHTPNNNMEDHDSKVNKYIVMDFKFKFKDLSAKLPSENPHLSNDATILKLDELKPLITYVNSKKTWYHSMRQKYGDPFLSSLRSSTYISNESPANNSSRNSGNALGDMGWTFTDDQIQHKSSYPEITVFSWPEDEDGNNSEGGKEIIKYHNIDRDTNNNEIILTCRVVENVQDLRNKLLFKETKIYDMVTMELYYDLMKVVEDWEYKKNHDWTKLWTATFMSQLLILGLGSIA